jgi:hypothetical protein
VNGARDIITRSCGSEIEDDRSNDVGCDAVEVGQKYPSLAVISF